MATESVCHYGAIENLSACILSLKDAYEFAFKASFGTEDVAVENQIEAVKEQITGIEHAVAVAMGKLVADLPYAT